MFDQMLASEQAFGTIRPMERTYVRRRLVLALAVAVMVAPSPDEVLQDIANDGIVPARPRAA